MEERERKKKNKEELDYVLSESFPFHNHASSGCSPDLWRRYLHDCKRSNPVVKVFQMRKEQKEWPRSLELHIRADRGQMCVSSFFIFWFYFFHFELSPEEEEEEDDNWRSNDDNAGVC